MLSIKLSPAVVLHSMIVVPVSVWVIHGPDRDIWPMLYEELTREYNKLVPKELAEFWSNRTVDELILLESAIEATKATWNDVITTMKKDVQLQAVAERLDRVHKQMQNQMNSLSPRSRRIMTQIIESVLTFNQGRFFISMVSFKELSSNDKKQIYGLFPWMRKIRQFFAWGAYYPEKFPLFVEKTNISGLPFKTAWAAEWAEPSWHQIVDEVSKSDKILGQRLYYFHQALCAKLARVTAQGFARPVMYEIIDNLIVAKKDRWLSAIDVFDHMTAFGADSMTGFKQLNRTFPWLNRHYTLMQFGAQELLGWNDEEDMRRTLHAADYFSYEHFDNRYADNCGRRS